MTQSIDIDDVAEDIEENKLKRSLTELVALVHQLANAADLNADVIFEEEREVATGNRAEVVLNRFREGKTGVTLGDLVMLASEDILEEEEYKQLVKERLLETGGLGVGSVSNSEAMAETLFMKGSEGNSSVMGLIPG